MLNKITVDNEDMFLFLMYGVGGGGCSRLVHSSGLAMKRQKVDYEI